LKNDSNNRPGKKIRKGLNTADREVAERLVGQLNEILRDESLWSVGARSQAEKRQFDDRVIEIFYAEIERSTHDSRTLRDQAIQFPARDSGWARALMIGVPGAGKTSLFRQLIGSHPERERFPSTSVNRTTTFPIEAVFRNGGYEAAVSFLSEHEARFEVEESVSAALLRAIEDDEPRVAKELLEQADMRFRLKYILGDFETESDDGEDPYAMPTLDLADVDQIPEEEGRLNQGKLRNLISRICRLAQDQRLTVENERGRLIDIEAEKKNEALDLIQVGAESSDEYTAIVSDIVEELRERFSIVSVGDFKKSTTGWPRLWHIKVGPSEREGFFSALRFFSGISVHQWGRLLTPLVNGIRVAGPFRPVWAQQQPRLVLIDTEGLGHKADASADLPDHVVARFEEADSIVLVQSGKNAMDYSVGKALEGIVSAGQTKKCCVVFTHMDVVEGPNLRGRAKYEHAFNNLRNIVENQLGKSLPSDVVRQVSKHLEESVFYLGKVNDAEAVPAYPQLRLFLKRLEGAVPKPIKTVSFPSYSQDTLVLSIREASEGFRIPWRSRLGIQPIQSDPPYPWQSIKAMTRRYAEGFDDGYALRPTSNLLAALSVAISRFLESPLSWEASPSEEEKREIIDRIKARVTKGITVLSQKRLREESQPQWQIAYTFRGPGSTVERKDAVESIYERWVPIPTSYGDQRSQEFLTDVKSVVIGAIDSVREEMAADEQAVSI
jgi:hypothetical protein